MSKAEFNITTTFYAKWILPFVLMLIGVLLLLLFIPQSNFDVHKNKVTQEVTVYYMKEIEKETKYISITDKIIYDRKQKGSTGYEYISTGEVYTKRIPKYNKILNNLSTIGTASGISLEVVGIAMLIINIFNKISKYDPVKGKQKKEKNED